MAFLLAASAVISAVGAVEGARSQANAADYNATIARQNAVIAQQQGTAAAEIQDRTARRSMGAAIAGYGSSGVDGGSGSAMDVLADAARSATLDNLTTKYNYALKGLGYSNQAELTSNAATGYRTAGALSGMGALTSGLGRAIPMFGGAQTTPQTFG